MSSSRRHPRPVIVEVQPSNLIPTPSSPGGGKAVRFAPTSNNAISRPLSQTEAWSLYHFEKHAKHCSSCFEPYNVFLRGDRLCPIGHGLAQDVAYHVYHLDGEFYSTASKDAAAKLVRVEIPAPYTNLRGLLRCMDRALRSRQTPTARPVPIISYDRTYSISARRSSTDNPALERAQVIVDAASSPRKSTKSHHSSSSHRRSTHKSHRYSTVVVSTPEDDEDAVDSAYEYEDGDYSVKSPLQPTSPLDVPWRRGGVMPLYERDSRTENYRVEVREPSYVDDLSRKEASSRRRKRKEGRGSVFWD